MNRCKLLLCLAGLLLTDPSLVVGQLAPKKNPPFRSTEYPKAEFAVTQSMHTFGDITIRILHVKRRKQSATPPSYCRAWVEISRDQKLVRRIYYDDFEPVGSKYGVFLPVTQPSPDLFVLVKEGDYDGRLLIVDQEGKLTNTFGGFFFFASERFLVSNYSSDEAGLAVFDLQAHKLILQTTDLPYVQRWYKDRAGYFFTESEWSGTSAEPHEKQGTAYRLNLQKAKIEEITITPSQLKSAARVKYDFDPRSYEDCVSK